LWIIRLNFEFPPASLATMCLLGPEASPFPDVAVSWLLEDAAEDLTPQDEDLIRSVVSRLCTKSISMDDCRVALSPLLTSMRALNRLGAVLHCQSERIRSGRLPESSSHRRARPWSQSEDNRLLWAVHSHGVQAWPAISKFVGNGRSHAQCAQRWFRGLDPRISKEDWTTEDDARLLQLVVQHGERGWTWVSGEMGNRSDVQCRYRYFKLKRTGRHAPILEQFRSALGQQPRAAAQDETAKRKGRPMKNPWAFRALIESVPLFAPPEQATPAAKPVSGRFALSDPVESLIDWNNDEWEGDWPHPTRTASHCPIPP
jgi:hypothetical protein